jgi:TctA family transporter
MELLHNLSIGFSTALSAINLLYCFTGVLLGTLIGVLPGLGAVATIAMLLPATYSLPPVSGLIMLAGIYYGAQYGGSTTAILVNLPGETSSVVTALDGYQMALKGRAGAALAISAVGSFVAGTLATLLIILFATPLAELALAFGPADYFSLMVLGLVASVVLAHGSLLKAIAMILLGLLVGLVGTDVSSGLYRFTFGQPEMVEGVSFIAVAMGLFGLGEIIRNLEQETDQAGVPSICRVGSLMPTRDEIRRSVAPIFRGTALGSALGVLPGGGAMLASFAAYSLEKKLSAHPEEFGHGAIEAVAGPESANNAGAQTSFIPLLTMGIPSNAVMALMAGAMILHGIQPGPMVMMEQPALFWGMIASMWIGNVILVVLNLPLVGIWVRLLAAPYHLMFPVIVIICTIGAFSVNNSVFDVQVMVAFGLLGYVFYKLECEPAPLLLGFILGPMMEEYLRRAMLLSRGHLSVFFTRPISAALLLLSVIAMAMVILPAFSKTRGEAFREED